MHKNKHQRETVLLFGEGSEDEALLKHLVNNHCDLSVRFITPHCGYGGSALDVVKEAAKRCQLVYYDKVVVVIDGDRHNEAEYKKASELAIRLGFELVIINPCMESLLLRVLEPKKNWNSKQTKECKRYFEATYVRRDRRTNARAYAICITKEKVEKARGTIDELDIILGWITNKPL